MHRFSLQTLTSYWEYLFLRISIEYSITSLSFVPSLIVRSDLIHLSELLPVPRRKKQRKRLTRQSGRGRLVTLYALRNPIDTQLCR